MQVVRQQLLISKENKNHVFIGTIPIVPIMRWI
jgi:hypothetical protein